MKSISEFHQLETDQLTSVQALESLTKKSTAEPRHRKRASSGVDQSIRRFRRHKIESRIDMENIPPFTEKLSTLLDDKDSSDFTVICGSAKWYVHKLILSASSEFFRAAVKQDMKVSKTRP